MQFKSNATVLQSPCCDRMKTDKLGARVYLDPCSIVVTILDPAAEPRSRCPTSNPPRKSNIGENFFCGGHLVFCLFSSTILYSHNCECISINSFCPAIASLASPSKDWSLKLFPHQSQPH
jgi:hypothetical protein